MANVRLSKPAVGRTITQKVGSDTPDWDAVVARILGPTVTPADIKRKHADALALAAAAMKAAEKLNIRKS